jgi:hypothetical protein
LELHTPKSKSGTPSGREKGQSPTDLEDAVFDGVVDLELEDVHRPRLPDTVRAIKRLVLKARE